MEWRRHFELKDERAGVSFRLTQISHVSGAQDRDAEVVLIEDGLTKDRITVTVTTDFMKRAHATEVRLLDTNETLTVSYPTPWKSLTRDGVISESRTNPERMAGRIERLTINVNGVEQTLGESEWKAPASVPKKSVFWRAASSRFLDVLHRLRAIGTKSELLPDLCLGVIAFVLYDPTCAPGPEIVNAQPDCAFDASFRYPCSQKSLDRIKNAKEQGRSDGVY